MKKKFNTKPIEFKTRDTENDLKEYILGLDFRFHSWVKKTMEKKETVWWEERPNDSLSPTCSSIEYYTIGYYECKRCKLIANETQLRFSTCIDKMIPPKEERSCNIPYPGLTRKKLYERLLIDLQKDKEHRMELLRNPPQALIDTAVESIRESSKRSPFRNFPKMSKEERKKNEKEIYWFLKESELHNGEIVPVICPCCFFAGGELTGLSPELKPIKKKWGISFAACEICKGNTWIDGNFSNHYNAKFDRNGHLNDWAIRFLDYNEIIRVSKTRNSNDKFWNAQNIKETGWKKKNLLN